MCRMSNRGGGGGGGGGGGKRGVDTYSPVDTPTWLMHEPRNFHSNGVF